MKKKIITSAIAVLLMFTLCSCNSAPASYKDGVYEGKSGVYQTGEGTEDVGSGYGVIKITVKDNEITACEFNTYEEDGTLKDDSYGMKDGKIANQDFYNKAQKAVKACNEYAKSLIETNDPEMVDAISGATINNTEFKEAAYDALEKAKAAN